MGIPVSDLIRNNVLNVCRTYNASNPMTDHATPLQALPRHVTGYQGKENAPRPWELNKAPSTAPKTIENTNAPVMFSDRPNPLKTS